MSSRAVCLAIYWSLLCSAAFSQNEDKYDTNQRITRIRDLGKKGPEVIPALAQNLTDRNRNVRLEAVKAIVKIDGEASLDPLVKATHDNDPEIQIRATDGIVNFYLPGYVTRGALTGLMTRGVRQIKSFFSSRNDQAIEKDRTARADVAEALGALVSGGSSLDSRSNAALAAGILRARPAVPALVRALHAQNNDLIFECLVALQKIEDPAAGPGVSFLARDLDDRIQITALETIGKLRSLDSALDVRAALTDARNIKTRRAALNALAMLGIPGDHRIFMEYIRERDADLRASALEGLGRIRDPEDIPTLERAYNEQNADPKVHLAAAFGLVDEGKINTEQFGPLRYLFENLASKRYSDTATVYTIELARRDDVRTALFKLVPEAGKDQKLALCSIFSEANSEDVIPVLNGLAKDIDSDVAFAASKALRIVQARKAS